MNKLILLFGVLLCLVAVNARHFERLDESEDQDSSSKPREHVSGHRRRRWQSSYGYDYSPPSFYYERRDDRYSQDIQNIYRLLEDISNYLRRTPPPPPPPQPIYIPYPMALPIPSCTPRNTTVPDVGKRINNGETIATMDQNRNWGFIMPSEDELPEDENDGARPISFVPLVPKQLMKRPPPAVEHGSVSHRTVYSESVTAAPRFPASAPLSSSFATNTAVPGMCNAAILSCCGFSGDTAQQRQCFTNIGCNMSYNSNSCTLASIQRALDSFKAAYSPKETAL